MRRNRRYIKIPSEKVDIELNLNGMNEQQNTMFNLNSNELNMWVGFWECNTLKCECVCALRWHPCHEKKQSRLVNATEEILLKYSSVVCFDFKHKHKPHHHAYDSADVFEYMRKFSPFRPKMACNFISFTPMPAEYGNFQILIRWCDGASLPFSSLLFFSF